MFRNLLLYCIIYLFIKLLDSNNFNPKNQYDTRVSLPRLSAISPAHKSRNDQGGGGGGGGGGCVSYGHDTFNYRKFEHRLIVI